MVKKNLVNNAKFKQSLADAQKNKANSKVNYKKKFLGYKYDELYPMVVTEITSNRKGYVFETNIFTGIKTVKDSFFFTNSPKASFVDDFMTVVVPDSDDIRDVIGVPFEGKVVQQNGFTNLKAVDILELEEDEDFEEEEED